MLRIGNAVIRHQCFQPIRYINSASRPALKWEKDRERAREYYHRFVEGEGYTQSYDKVDAVFNAMSQNQQELFVRKRGNVKKWQKWAAEGGLKALDDTAADMNLTEEIAEKITAKVVGKGKGRTKSAKKVEQQEKKPTKSKKKPKRIDGESVVQPEAPEPKEKKRRGRAKATKKVEQCGKKSAKSKKRPEQINVKTMVEPEVIDETPELIGEAVSSPEVIIGVVEEITKSDILTPESIPENKNNPKVPNKVAQENFFDEMKTDATYVRMMSSMTSQEKNSFLLAQWDQLSDVSKELYD